MQRRTFLKYSLLSLTAVATGLLLYSFSNRKHYIQKVVRKDLDYIKVNDADLDRFADDFVKYANSRLLKELINTSIFISIYQLYDFFFSTQKSRRLLNEHICKIFLLSSDFFHRKAEAGTVTPVRYILLYDPHRFPCQNPFAEGLRLKG